MGLIETIFSSIMGVGFLYLAGSVFFPDAVSNKIKELKDRAANKSTAEKIAQVKLVSDDPKDIEKFISANARYLSDRLVKQLVSRIELIKCDQIIMEDALKTRIAAVATSRVPEEELEVELQMPARRQRR